MVILLGWQQAAADVRRSGAVAMPGEDASSGAQASPLVGYLGKVQERAASLDCCPWCASKGLSSSLRLYRLNLHESITLCTEPQCLFPLVSRPLEDVLASLVPAETAAGGRKRKTLQQPDEDDYEPIKVKRLRSDQLHADAGSGDLNGHYDATITRVQQSNGKSCPPQDGVSNQSATCTGPTRCPSFSVAPQIDEDIGYSDQLGSAPDELVSGPYRPGESEEPVDAPEKPVDAPNETVVGPVTAPQEPIAAPSEPINTPVAAPDKTVADPVTAPEELIAEPVEDSDFVDAPVKPGVSAPAQLFWKNAHNLCWLDVLLVLLVNCGSLRKHKPQHEPRRAAVWRLLSGYDGARDALRAGSGGDARAPREADERLQELRAAVFELLQPRLRCKLGQKESPVFAMPLLLAADSWAEPLFRTTFRWEFKCSKCEKVAGERVTKTLPTFTNVLPDWHPMRATHLALCNACGAQHQHRRMTLERVPPVLALHFVEGLPHGDVEALGFTWAGRRHTVTALVQYDRRAKHFVAWTRTPDGSWLEFDDLKHPESALHPTLAVPSPEMHLLFWEAEEDSPGSGACSPSSTRPDSQSSRRVASDRHLSDEASEESSLFLALDEEENATTADARGDVSVGSTTLLDTFHGLSHDDIITLTLMEVQADAPTDHEALLDCVPAPDSSSLTPDDPDEAPSGSAESDVDNADKDPDFEPASEQAPKRSKRISAVRRRSARKTAGTKAAPPQELDTQDGRANAQDFHPPPPSVQTALPMSSAGPPPLDQKSRWSYMLSQLPVSQRPTSTEPPPAPVNQFKPLPSHSTAVPARRPAGPRALFLKPQLLRTDDGLPLKSAERFGAFGAAVQIPPPPPPKCSRGGDICAESAGSWAPPPAVPSATEALRRKLLKKLKAKKKKLAKLNQLLAGAAPVSPVSVTSSSTCDSLLPSDPPLPSPDSSGFLDVLAGRRDGTPAAQPQMENFLDEFLSTSETTEAQRAMENEALRELELFLL
ncbi:LOW QUALITY PROTEIN: SUMO-specific isopeptidase USPL1 [Phycodurus eques]|uniref:LOW QUALITY PROTEIN: SUMO-specific isopeptidase USPL1 n=1 Tax=Phycodurus eques TaxID=693459 RepID=UPI002ACE1B9D|nr:LOW QUALITY PROTEIN: SUMO-specific isopeptidase USPL1 [Phycodurus eques]